MQAPVGYQHETDMFRRLVEFEQLTFSPSNYGLGTGWKDIDDALEGIQPGFHLIAGNSNMGKTSFLSQLEMQLIKTNPDVHLMSFSLDDPGEEKICRLVACSERVPINAVKNPSKYQHMPQAIQRRNTGLYNLVNNVSRIAIYDEASIYSTVENLMAKVNATIQGFANSYNPKRVVVTIDNFHDLHTNDPSVGKGDASAKFDFLAQYIADTAKQMRIPIICTAEFRKLNSYKRPTIYDIRETVKIQYEAKSIMLCFNEVSMRGEAADVYYTDTGKPQRQPVFELHFAKNKYSAFKGRHFFYFRPECAFFDPATTQDRDHYNRVISAL
jgi:replicative DNA helicase